MTWSCASLGLELRQGRPKGDQNSSPGRQRIGRRPWSRHRMRPLHLVLAWLVWSGKPGHQRLRPAGRTPTRTTGRLVVLASQDRRFRVSCGVVPGNAAPPRQLAAAPLLPWWGTWKSGETQLSPEPTGVQRSEESGATSRCHSVHELAECQSLGTHTTRGLRVSLDSGCFPRTDTSPGHSTGVFRWGLQ